MNWLNDQCRTANTFSLYFCAPWKVVTGAAVSLSLLTAILGWPQPVPGSLDVHWNEGARDCGATPQDALQVHSYEPQTFILRQSPCASFEANFLYLLIGSDKSLLIDTGAVEDPKKMPLAKAILELLPDKDHAKLPILVAHTHRHSDHHAGDPQFASLPSVQIVPIDLEGVRAFYGFANWPNGIAHVDLGGRIVDVIPTPGLGSHYHPNEHRLELAKEDLTALPVAFEGFNGFYARHPNFILTNPIHNLLALAVIAIAILIFIVWGVRRLLRVRRHARG